ncbi:MAG: FtsX-like permease family protein [Anaerobacillus sp.]|uniref:FtsX-like permease family protein n=1 Tax=Anaerobacillus sp. TaxID=1872506 RepID=UPI00391A450B
MTFNQVALKNFRQNLHRYLFYYLSNSFAVMIIFMFSTLLFNENLYASTEVERELILIPTVVLAIFSVFFIGYAHSVFMKSRQKEFGLFMTLGMAPRDIRKLIFFETSMLSIASLVTGLVAGAIFSRLFFLLIMRLTSITTVSFELNSNSFLFSISYFTVIFIFLLVGTLVITSRLKIVTLLKAERTSQKNKISSPWFGMVGIVILLSALIYFYSNFYENPENDGKVLLYSTLFVLVGLYITISQLGSVVLNLFKKLSPTFFYRRIMLLTNLNYKFKQVKTVNFLIAMMVFVTMFYSGHILRLYLSSEEAAVQSNPYDIAFVQTETKNRMTSEQIHHLAGNENLITEYKTLEILNYFDENNYNSRTVFISDDQLSEVAKRPIQVQPGKYVLLVQLMLQTEQEKHSFIEDAKLDVPSEINVSIQDSIFEYMLNSLSFLDHRLFILNDSDYQALRGSAKTIELAEIQLMNVEDWKKSEPFVQALNVELAAFNETTELYKTESIRRVIDEQELFKTSSKIELYNYHRQGGGIILYLFMFIGLLFFIATCIILYLKMYSEFEDEKKKYQKLFKVGITKKEMKKNIAGELKVLFFVAPLIGIMIALTYTLVFYKNSGIYAEIFSSIFLLSGSYMVFQIVYYFISKRNFERKMF